jgi:hypothetical protein
MHARKDLRSASLSKQILDKPLADPNAQPSPPQASKIFQLCQHVRIAAGALAEMLDEA